MQRGEVPGLDILGNYSYGPLFDTAAFMDVSDQRDIAVAHTKIYVDQGARGIFSHEITPQPCTNIMQARGLSYGHSVSLLAFHASNRVCIYLKWASSRSKCSCFSMPALVSVSPTGDIVLYNFRAEMVFTVVITASVIASSFGRKQISFHVQKAIYEPGKLVCLFSTGELFTCALDCAELIMDGQLCIRQSVLQDDCTIRIPDVHFSPLHALPRDNVFSCLDMVYLTHATMRGQSELLCVLTNSTIVILDFAKPNALYIVYNAAIPQHIAELIAHNEPPENTRTVSAILDGFSTGSVLSRPMFSFNAATSISEQPVSATLRLIVSFAASNSSFFRACIAVADDNLCTASLEYATIISFKAIRHVLYASSSSKSNKSAPAGAGSQKLLVSPEDLVPLTHLVSAGKAPEASLDADDAAGSEWLPEDIAETSPLGREEFSHFNVRLKGEYRTDTVTMLGSASLLPDIVYLLTVNGVVLELIFEKDSLLSCRSSTAIFLRARNSRFFEFKDFTSLQMDNSASSNRSSLALRNGIPSLSPDKADIAFVDTIDTSLGTVPMASGLLPAILLLGPLPLTLSVLCIHNQFKGVTMRTILLSNPSLLRLEAKDRFYVMRSLSASFTYLAKVSADSSSTTTLLLDKRLQSMLSVHRKRLLTHINTSLRTIETTKLSVDHFRVLLLLLASISEYVLFSSIAEQDADSKSTLMALCASAYSLLAAIAQQEEFAYEGSPSLNSNPPSSQPTVELVLSCCPYTRAPLTNFESIFCERCTVCLTPQVSCRYRELRTRVRELFPTYAAAVLHAFEAVLKITSCICPLCCTPFSVLD